MWGCVTVFFLIICVFLKVYLRNHVAHEIYTALTHFKKLEPVMDLYGRNKTKSSQSVPEIVDVNETVFSSSFFIFVFTVYNDGTKKNLMSLTGTIPVLYDGKNDFAFFMLCAPLIAKSSLEAIQNKTR